MAILVGGFVAQAMVNGVQKTGESDDSSEDEGRGEDEDEEIPSKMATKLLAMWQLLTLQSRLRQNRLQNQVEHSLVIQLGNRLAVANKGKTQCWEMNGTIVLFGDRVPFGMN
ncbi:hypothetical protein FH972_016529 [Carpinus fangiana]|uniref:Uncharacterized protein n=1 Tax=Carpinus fangiana TaxID=176857 RepID=A0A5N6RJN1_9ROSI|nr:hypothetical protein FH972_016529 [Carpinus fangiana]